MAKVWKTEWEKKCKTLQWFLFLNYYIDRYKENVKPDTLHVKATFRKIPSLQQQFHFFLGIKLLFVQ